MSIFWKVQIHAQCHITCPSPAFESCFIKRKISQIRLFGFWLFSAADHNGMSVQSVRHSEMRECLIIPDWKNFPCRLSLAMYIVIIWVLIGLKRIWAQGFLWATRSNEETDDKVLNFFIRFGRILECLESNVLKPDTHRHSVSLTYLSFLVKLPFFFFKLTFFLHCEALTLRSKMGCTYKAACFA